MNFKKLLNKTKNMSLNGLIRDIKDATNKRARRFFWQRMTRGWDDSETWSLDYSLAKVILPRLKRFKQITIATPGELKEQEWNDILDKMIVTFEFAASEERWNATPEDYDKHNEGLKLFAEYYWALWW
jgi:hypothetical protein